MSRLPPVDEKKDPEIAAVFAEITASRGYVSNAFRSMAHAPEALRRFASVGDYARYHTRLSGRQREIVIITTARGTPYALAHHGPLGIQVGLTRAEVDSLAAGVVPPTFGPADAALVNYVVEFTSGKPVAETTFQALRAVMSPREITDVSVTSAFFAALAMIITTMRVELEPEEGLRLEADWQRKKSTGK